MPLVKFSNPEGMHSKWIEYFSLNKDKIYFVDEAPGGLFYRFRHSQLLDPPISIDGYLTSPKSNWECVKIKVDEVI